MAYYRLQVTSERLLEDVIAALWTILIVILTKTNQLIYTRRLEAKIKAAWREVSPLLEPQKGVTKKGMPTKYSKRSISSS